MALNHSVKHPSVWDMEQEIERSIPKFAFDYLMGGIGDERNLRSNIEALAEVKLRPKYLSTIANEPDMSIEAFGNRYDAPFGMAPIGLTGLMWPKASEFMSVAAKKHNIPFALSGFSTSSVEDIKEASNRAFWYQQYATIDDEIDRNMLLRAKEAGAEALIITVDIPTSTPRRKNAKNGLSVPPKFNLRTLAQVLSRPRWAMAMAKHGVPEFRNIKPYIPKGLSLAELGVYASELIEGHVSLERLKFFRDNWEGKFIVKGLLDPEEAALCKSVGVDGIVVSNHGGRQLDAAETAPSLLPLMREAVGSDVLVMADGGVRTGLDVARMLASGADLVLCGRAFMMGMGTIGEKGADHVATILKEELRSTMAQIGCPEVKQLPNFLAPRS
ncbi:alpha-hydroxy-acid oxidizing protein [Alphaproteobacteria bacterium]|nr:alpha-hydroxy-acid oxidizing protein [Alphaproteobacteria bacterium]